MKAYKLAAPAKINLTLEVVARLPNGYHAIRSVIARIPRLHDTVHVRIDERRTGLRVTCDHPDIPPDEGNVCHQAATAFQAATGRSARIDVHVMKRLPIAAGLGGGSSDAAAVLSILNHHFGHPCSKRRLETIGAEVGKDLPFFLRAAPAAVVSGMGETVRALPALPPMHVLLVNPGVAISTRKAYAELSRKLWFMTDASRSDRTKAMARAVLAGDLRGIALALYNDFERSAEDSHPIIADVKHCLRSFGALGALMSGSGSTLFGLFDSPAARVMARAALRAQYPDFLVANT